MAYLVIHLGKFKPQRVKLGDSAVIGRAVGNAVWIDDTRLSKQHCRIEHRGNQWVLLDMDSMNGTYIGETKIEQHVLAEGETINIGNARIIFHEGELTERPSDPLAATSTGLGQGKLEVSLDSSTLSGYRLPTPQPEPQAATAADRTGKAVSLAFQRPKAKPIIKEESPDDSGGSRWIRAIISRLRRR